MDNAGKRIKSINVSLKLFRNSMALSKLKSKPSPLQIDANAWMSDPFLRLCSPETRGLWIDILCLMHQSEERGFLMLKSEILSEQNLRKILNFPKKKFEFCMQELTHFEIIKKDEKGRLYSKSMVDAQSLSEKRRQSGKLGGNPKLKILVNQMVKQVVKQMVKQNNFGEKNIDIYTNNNIYIDNIDNIDNKGYNNQIPLFEEKERKYEKKERETEKSQNLILVTHPLQVYIRDNCPQVSKLKKQISAEECEKLLTKFTNQQIASVLLQMENFKQLPSKYVSVYLTLNNWLNRQPNESTTRTNTPNRGADYENALRNF